MPPRWVRITRFETPSRKFAKMVNRLNQRMQEELARVIDELCAGELTPGRNLEQLRVGNRLYSVRLSRNFRFVFMVIGERHGSGNGCRTSRQRLRSSGTSATVKLPTNRITTHPGAFLLEQIEEMGLTVNGLARDIVTFWTPLNAPLPSYAPTWTVNFVGWSVFR
ncbi:MAG: hypothetical protein F4Z30_09355 [Gemmatimonadetes bacterium]|nr:hypothetical protein [Gemmatimonadota bacterium]